MKITDINKEDYSKYVGLLTIEEKDILVGQWYMPDSFFNPLQDADDNWIISVEEMDQCVNPDMLWVKELTLIPYNPKPTPPFP